MRLIYKYVSQRPPERYLKAIEAAGFEVTIAATFATLQRAARLLEFEQRVILIEISSSDLQQALDFIKRMNSNLTADTMSRVAVLALFTTEQPESVWDFLEDENAICLDRCSPEIVIRELRRLWRVLRRLNVKALLRIAIDGSRNRVWMSGPDNQQHEFVLPPKLLELLLCLAINRYSTASFIESCLRLKESRAKIYIKRLRDAYDRFNREELHCGLSGKQIFKTLEFDEGTIYRIHGKVVFDK